MNQIDVLNSSQFIALKDILYKETGIVVADDRKSFFETRLFKLMHEVKIHDWDELLSILLSTNKKRLIEEFISCLTTNKTHFFREAEHFEYIINHYLPDLCKHKNLYVWCAAASTGEEPYTLACEIDHFIKKSNRFNELKLLATDIDNNVLAQCMQGVYPAERFGESIHQLPFKNYIIRGTGNNSGYYKFKNEIVDKIKFRNLNLTNVVAYPSMKFDLIMIRNVLIYFDKVTVKRIIHALATRLHEGGLLILGMSEAIDYEIEGLSYLGKSIYKRCPKLSEMSTSKITHVKKVIVVDDSLPVQKVIKRCLKDDSDIKVVSTASSAMEALEQIKIYKPDVITLDIQMPEMTGIEFLKKYAKELDIAVIIVSSFSKDDSDYYFQSLELGAFEYIEKPSFDSLDEISKKLCRTIKSSKKIREVLSLKNIKIVKVKKHHISKIENNIVVIGSSTGGVEALKEIFNSYPCEIPPTIVIQHIPESFSMKLAARFNELYEFTVKEAEHNETILKNTIYIAPGGKQLKIVKTGSVIKLFVTDDPPFNRHKPSVDFFFNSIANINEFDKHVVACILTGMGEDGARGLLRLKNNGFSTIAQDEESSVVFGMPRAAIKLNAAKYILPLKKIALMTFNKLK